MHRLLRNIFLMTTALMPLGIGFAVAGPNGGLVVGGGATISGQGTGNVVVNQSTNRAIINWHTFNIGQGETTRFNQPDASSVALNRVTGGLGASQIDGTLTANGRVFLINRDGVLFGPNSVVNTAGFLATTNDIANSDFMAGRYNFNIPGRPDASIVNQGTITATNSGFAALVAPGVRNTGTITATLGTVALASGNSFTLDFYGDRLITLAVGDSIGTTVRDVQTGRPLSSLVENSGRLSANGGRVELTAAAARQVVDSVINNRGVIEANSVGRRGGNIVLSAATAGSKPADAPKQTVRVSGTLSAKAKKEDGGENGGTVVITGEDIQVAGARIDVSGPSGGGTVLIGGDWGGGNPQTGLVDHERARLENRPIANASTVTVDAATTIDASATENGTGGKVVVWSDVATSFSGTILATGGPLGGNGGFVEVSGRQLNFNGVVDLRAPMGLMGTLLLDPFNLTISSNSNSGISNFTANSDDSNLNVDTLQNALALANVVVSTGGAGTGTQLGDITVGSDIAWASGSTLTLSAFHDVILAAGVTISNSGAGNLVLRADNSGTGSGTVVFNQFFFGNGGGGGGEFFSLVPTDGVFAPSRVDFRQSTGSVSIFYNPADGYTNPTDYRAPNSDSAGVLVKNSGQLTAYMLVNNVNNLQAVNTNLAGNYALGRDIDASAAGSLNNGQGFVPIGDMSSRFTGIFDGQGKTISNLTIAPSSNIQNIGLFGVIGAGATVRDLNLKNVTVTVNPNSSFGTQFVGTLAGVNAGTIRNVTATGSVTGLNNTESRAGVIAGGLVGQNGLLMGGIEGPTQQTPGLIIGSHANVAVIAGDGNGPNGGFSSIGGLVGSNVAGSEIRNSSAAGNVTGGANSSAGGLVGQNGFSGGPFNSVGFIQNSFATGNVTVSGFDAHAGGLVGSQGAGSSITDSQAFGTVVSNGAIGGTDDNFHSAGGLVGQNQGTITSSTQPSLIGFEGCGAGAAFSCASGNVVVGSFGSGGGLVGNNHGLIENAFATGDVTGNGTRTQVGGLAGQSGKCDFGCGNDNPEIRNSFAMGDVTGGSNSVVGGIAGIGSGLFNNVTTRVGQNVRGGDNSIVGGLIGVMDPDGGTISNSRFEGSVVAVGGNSIAGGLVGISFGNIISSMAFADVTVASNSYAGGLVGINFGTIQGTSSQPVAAAGTVTSCPEGCGGNNILGGLVGLNAGTIDMATAISTVESGGSSAVGGLVGANVRLFNLPADAVIPGSSFPVGTITNSVAIADVRGGSGSEVGGLVGVNALPSQLPPLPGVVASCQDGACTVLNDVFNNRFMDAGTIASSVAFAHVSGGSVSGGFVGFNAGSIDQSFAFGDVTVGSIGAADLFAGGFAGGNRGTITNSSALAVVNSSGGDAMLGGFAGFNQVGGTIANSFALGVSLLGIGEVKAVDASVATVGGFVGGNAGRIVDSQTSVDVTAEGTRTYAGGFVGRNFGEIVGPSSAETRTASGNVTFSGTAFALGGGFAGENRGSISQASAGPLVLLADGTRIGGAVIGGDGAIVGGFAGLNTGTISLSFAESSVTGGNNSVVGGLVGINLTAPELGPGVIFGSYAIGNVTGGTNSTVGGLIGANGGVLDQTYSIGQVTGGAGSTLGGLVGAGTASFSTPESSNATQQNALRSQQSTAPVQLASFVNTGTVTNSYWDVQLSGQTTSAGGKPFPPEPLPPGFDPLVWTPTGSYPCLQGGLCNGFPSRPFDPLIPPVIPPVTVDLPPPVLPDLPPLLPVLTLLPQLPVNVQFVALNQVNPQNTVPPEVVTPPSQNTQGGSGNSGRPGNDTTGSVGPLRPDGRPSNVPPITETRFINNQVVVQIGANVPPDVLDRVVRRLGLTILSSETNGLLGTRVIQFQIGSGRSVRDVIKELEKWRVVDEATPNYTFDLAQDATAPATEGDAAQYVVAKLRLTEAHQIAKGDDVLIAVIDSEIDGKHPDLEGSIKARFDAVGPADKPHPHGTGMAGAMASKRKLIGTAPNARLLAIRAFGAGSSGGQGTTLQIVKGLDWAVSQGARIVNMSFAGPKDPTLQKAFKLAYDRGIILVAAAGNAGPKSLPLYPGADGNVIAVTATDADDKVYSNANRGKYVAVAAPGVDILVPAPDGNYEFTTGTSVAAAEVSGVVALLLQRDPRLSPADVRDILTSTANNFGARNRTDELGYGLIDALKALQAVGAKSARAPTPVMTAARQ